ncbi:Aste57867_10089 [Aphanomyces stellatus]|uniref:Aste57867_10089 protein n=1 Tax=Aphanomyces stellatus TaxID=120398 RepID=A0A485KQ71_9STRA|nr:hypothetical protein As57867_010050 [Aphanomyces stellatus]VFT86965.1 Aste57867_10089 [Aphanomyces stellatus]
MASPETTALVRSIYDLMTDPPLTLPHVAFASQQPDDFFRAVVKSSSEGLPLSLWIESKRTKKQWQAIVSNMADHAAQGDLVLPVLVVVAALKRGLTDNSRPSNEPSDSTVDLCTDGGSVKLVLVLQACAGLEAKYAFELSAIDLPETHILKAIVADLQEEVRGFRDEMRALVASNQRMEKSLADVQASQASLGVGMGVDEVSDLVVDVTPKETKKRRKANYLR